MEGGQEGGDREWKRKGGRVTIEKRHVLLVGVLAKVSDQSFILPIFLLQV